MRTSDRTGFTLVEMLVSLMVLAVLLGITAPRLLISSERRVAMEAEQLLRNLEMARTRSMAQRVAVRIAFDDGSDPAYRAYQDHDSNDLIEQNSAEMREFAGFGNVELGRLVEFGRGSAEPFPGDLSGEDITLPLKRVEFDRRGLTSPLGTRGIIYLHHKDDPEVAAAVTVSGSGSFRVWRFTEEGWS